MGMIVAGVQYWEYSSELFTLLDELDPESIVDMNLSINTREEGFM